MNKLLITSFCLLITSMSCSFAKEGRYQAIATNSNSGSVIVIDTKTGKVRHCRTDDYGGDIIVECSQWTEEE
jgi:hypothetical protein